MKIAIKHQTKYYFNEKLPKLVQSLKLFPSICSNQKVIDWRINSNEGAIINSYQDSLGHKIYNLYIENIVGEQIICSSGIIDTKDLNGVISGLIEKVHPFCFLRETNLTKTSKNIIKISKNIKNKNNKIKFCHNLNSAVYKSIKYVSQSTSIETNSSAAINQGKGVCQDFAHILISSARYNDIPARYINGYLLDNTLDNKNSIHTTHAWVELYINDLGWVGFDPSHNKCIDDKYIRISCGFDALDASTIKGIKTNYYGKEALNVNLSINACQ